MSKTRVVGYVRVSTEGQAEDGVSLSAQRAKLEAYAVAMDLELVTVEVDAGVSAKTLDRPGLCAALELLEAGEVQGLLVAKLDRLTRSVVDLGWLVDSRRVGERWSLLSVADSIDTRSAAGRLVLNVLASVSQWEREATDERTKEALAHLRSKGVRLGAEGLGWCRCGMKDESGHQVVTAVEDEVETVDMIFRLRVEGLSLRAICAALEGAGRPTKRGGKWSPKVVRSILLRGQGKREQLLDAA